MTVINWYLLLFIESVCSIQNAFREGSSPRNPHACLDSYTCIPTAECAEKHSAQGIASFLFECEEKSVCCPPVRSPLPAYNYETNSYTTKQPAVSPCSKCSVQGNRPESVSNGVYSPKQEVLSEGTGHHVHNHNHNVHNHQPTEMRPQSSFENGQPSQAQPSESRLPSQAQSQAGRRPLQPQSQPSRSVISSHRNLRLLPSESHCGLRDVNNRITEGQEVSLGEYPWMVLTGVRDKFGNYRWNCGGTLINDWYVLTAAHCLIVDNRTVEYVRLGEHSLTNETDCYEKLCLDPPEDIPIAEVIPHEKWNITTIKNDIALLRLSRNPLKLGKSNIKPICLPLDPEKLNITSDTNYHVAGWGKTQWNAEEGSDVLRKASLTGVGRDECNICKDKKKQHYCPIIDTQLCVQGWKSVDVCKGDSGGPLMVYRWQMFQIGITSFKGSEYCGAENIPSIFTKVESFLPWILDNIKE